jgi:hypothetical protein
MRRHENTENLQQTALGRRARPSENLGCSLGTARAQVFLRGCDLAANDLESLVEVRSDDQVYHTYHRHVSSIARHFCHLVEQAKACLEDEPLAVMEAHAEHVEAGAEQNSVAEVLCSIHWELAAA